MTDFSSQVILITGAASGIGRATSIKLASLGATLALSDIQETELHDTRQKCEGVERHTIHHVDVSFTAACHQFVQDVIAQHGRLDHVFNCAGVNPTAYDLVDTTDEYWDKILNTNLKGTFAISRAAIPYLRNQSPINGSGSSSGNRNTNKNASIVDVSSILGVKGANRMAIYSASKWGVIGFTKSLALELGPQGIRVNAVAPGFINTPTNSDVIDGPEAMRRSAEKVAMGRLGTAEEVADVVVWLMGGSAGYVNGSVIEINGGLA